MNSEIDKKNLGHIYSANELLTTSVGLPWEDNIDNVSFFVLG